MTTVESVYQHHGYAPSLLKHSGLGIASFIVSLMVGAVEFLVIMAAGIIEATTPGGMDEQSMAAIVVGLFILGGLMANMAGVGLGIAGLVQRDRKKVFSTLGLVFNGTAILGIVMLMVIGTMAP